MNKRELRKHIKFVELTQAYIDSASHAICQKVISSNDFQSAQSIFVFVSLKKEPQTKEIIEEAWRMHKKVYVPKCISDTEMIAVEIDSWSDLEPQTMGILEPKKSEPISNTFDIGIIPCVSASRDGKRLGHGAGYYDRFLEKTAMKTICVCFKKCLRDDIPETEYDQRMNVVISD